MPFDLDNFLNTNTLAQYPPKTGLEAWHAASQHETHGAAVTVFDLSGNARDLEGDSFTPALESNLNSQFTIEFTGSETPLYSPSFTVGVQHLFILASFGNATFSSNNEGLISGLNVGALLLGGGAASTNFFNVEYGEGYEYRKSDVAYAESAQAAPVNGAWGICEIKFPTGIEIDGLQIGQDRAFTGRRWVGSWAESLVYSRVLTELERERVFYYLALKYYVWRISGGLPVFPFPADRQRSSDRGKEVYLSEPYAGDPKALIRGEFRRQFSCPFNLRPQAEMDAAEAFHAARYPDPTATFMFRDYRYSPARDREVRFASPITEQGSDVSFRFNYSFDLVEP